MTFQYPLVVFNYRIYDRYNRTVVSILTDDWLRLASGRIRLQRLGIPDAHRYGR